MLFIVQFSKLQTSPSDRLTDRAGNFKQETINFKKLYYLMHATQQKMLQFHKV